MKRTPTVFVNLLYAIFVPSLFRWIVTDFFFFRKKILPEKKIIIYLQPQISSRAISSAGSEHLPYKQGATGSNPVSPTTVNATFSRVFPNNGKRFFCLASI